MGVCASDEDVEKLSGETTPHYTLLLVGAGESGKSTICKQMEYLHCGGFSSKDRKLSTPIIRNNIIEYMQTLVAEAKRFNSKDSKNAKDFKIDEELARELKISQYDSDDNMVLTPDLSSVIFKLWESSAIQKTYARRSEYQLDDSAQYFIQKAEHIAGDTYIPTNDDMIRKRTRSAGIQRIEMTFFDVRFTLIDVGGQRSEQRKWNLCYEECTAVLFIAALSAYDQLAEDRKTNRMTEALNLFEKICKDENLKEKPLILFLNKKDIFLKKIENTPITVCDDFRKYAGPGKDAESSALFIEQEFKNRNAVLGREIFVHRTCAVDPENIQHVFKAVKTVVVSSLLAYAGLLR